MANVINTGVEEKSSPVEDLLKLLKGRVVEKVLEVTRENAVTGKEEKVLLCRANNGRFFVTKVGHPKEAAVFSDICKLLPDEPSIVRLFGTTQRRVGYDDWSDTDICVSVLHMEYANGGDMFKFLEGYTNRGEPVDRKVVSSFMVQLSGGLVKIHEKNIVVRDIKPANILLHNPDQLDHDQPSKVTADTRVKYTDFDHSAILPKGVGALFHMNRKGTPGFYTPRVARLRRENRCTRLVKHYDPYSADVWCLGMTFFWLMTSFPAFLYGKKWEECWNRCVERNDFTELLDTYNLSSRFEPGWLELVTRMLHKDSKERPTAKEVFEAVLALNPEPLEKKDPEEVKIVEAAVTPDKLKKAAVGATVGAAAAKAVVETEAAKAVMETEAAKAVVEI